MLTKKQRGHLEQRLLQERARALKALAQFDQRMRATPQEKDGDLTIYPLHLADEGTDTDEQEKSYLLASKEGRLLYWIDDALRTLYKEPARYGKCLQCERDIPYERLEIIPWARYCVECQREEEVRREEVIRREAIFREAAEWEEAA